MKNKFKIMIVIIVGATLLTLYSNKRNENVVLKVNVLFSLSGNYEYRLYYENIVSKLNDENELYEIVPTYVQTDTETVLKVIYDKAEENSYDFMLIHPKYTDILERQSLVYPLNEVIAETVGLEILSSISPGSLKESFNGSEIMSFPFMREQYYLASKSIEENFITLSDLPNLDISVYIPLKNMIENLLLSNENLLNIENDEDFNLVMTNVVQMLESNKLNDYKMNNYPVDMFKYDNFVVSSLTLDRNNFNQSNNSVKFSNFNYSNEKIKGVLGSNIFKVNRQQLTPVQNLVFKDLVDIIMTETNTYNFPITKKQMNSIDSERKKYYEDEFYSEYIFNNIANVDILVSKLYVDLMKSNYELAEIINSFQQFIIVKERAN